MPEELNYHSLAGLVAAAETAGQPLSALVLRQQAAQLEQPEDRVFAHMRENFRVMAACIEPGCQPDLRSASGLTGGDACKMRRRVEEGKTLTGPVLILAGAGSGKTTVLIQRIANLLRFGLACESREVPELSPGEAGAQPASARASAKTAPRAL